MSFQGVVNLKPEERGIRATAELPTANPREVFAELLELLEEYGPSWYTEEHHRRAVTALQKLRGSTQPPRQAISAD